jgi:antitoxin component of RelBE/YafQ-DinJ toxin-antitoxin module
MANMPDGNKQIFGARLHKDLVLRFDEIAEELGLTRSDAIRAYINAAIKNWLENGCQYSAAEKEKIQDILDDERRLIRQAGKGKVPRRQASGG